MKTRALLPLQKAVQKLALLLVSAVMFLGLIQPAVQATPIPTSQSTTQEISPDELSQKRANRRAQQSRASQAADTEVKANSLGEVLEDKLNLEEIAEENVLTNDSNGVPDDLARNEAMQDRLN